MNNIYLPTHRSLKRTAALTTCLVLFSLNSFGFLYGEHKRIGDEAFLNFSKTTSGPGHSFFFSSLGADVAHPYLGFLSQQGSIPVSYGILNGLSGDHEDNPVALQKQLLDKLSVVQRIISLHQEYINKGFPAAPDGKLASLDLRYALLAMVNMSHFYRYGKDLNAQLKAFDPGLIKQGQNDQQARDVFRKLNGTDALTMYLTVHLMAVDMAAQAGRIYQTEPENAIALIRKAILFNGFADHFLEDMFSAGHLVVDRSVFASLTNNKTLHDFYSANGSTVVNRKGEVWKAYGDGYLQQSQPDRIIQAISFSLDEVYDAFNDGKTLPAETALLINNCKPLKLIPLPYNTDLRPYLPDSLITPAAEKASQLLPQRNFIRSRIANSIVFGFNNHTFSDNYLQGGEFRVNFGLFSKRYKYNDHGTKSGKLDYWHGYTLSYGFGRMGVYQSTLPYDQVHLLKGGIRSNYDYWISDKKFIGFTNYMETGLLFIDRKTALAFIPSVGLQLGPLVNINYYNMPGWLRIPAQFFLPLEIRLGSVLASGHRTSFFSGVDLTYAF